MDNHNFSVGWVVAEKWPYRNVMASTRIRCLDIIRYLKERGLKTGRYHTFRKYDVVVFQKAFNETFCRMASKIRSRGARIILDINVNYFEKSGDTLQVTEKHIRALHRFLEFTDIILVSSLHLKEIAQKYHADICYIPEHISTIGSYAPLTLSDPVKLVYCGYAIKADSVLLIKNVLRRLADLYNIEVLFICEKDPHIQLPVRTSFIRYDQKRLADILRQGHIKIAPRKLDNSYDLGHSFTKIGYPMSAGLPVVASPVPSYQGSPALTARSEEEWFEHISSLMNSPELYSQLSKEGISFVREHYSLEKIGPMYLDVFRRLLHA